MNPADARVGRFYTAARRHPWVLGKVADWKIPLGPYTPAQIAVAVGGCFLLIKTISWWSWMGPVPVVAWLLAVWAVRRPRVRGRAPMQAALGWLLLAWQPRGGRIGGRAARDRAARPLLGGFTLEDPLHVSPTDASARTGRRSAGRADAAARRGRGSADRAPHRSTAPPAASLGPVSGVQQLLALAEKSGGAR
ncbi:hypothetical protein [Streptomyces sp. NPDC059215]|uniref:hypothetical protein n=1 Tax=Streptomyces sp. NPDC059215 TaxID=3346772 RepID=UPI00369C16DE